MKKLATLYLFLYLFLVAPSVQAATYWVRPTGTLGGCVPSSSTPGSDSGYMSTVTAGLQCLSAGDTLNIRTGTYSEVNLATVSQTVPTGTSGARITIQAFDGARTVTIRHPGSGNVAVFTLNVGQNYFTIDGLVFDGASAAPNNSDGVQNLGNNNIWTNFSAIRMHRPDTVGFFNFGSDNTFSYCNLTDNGHYTTAGFSGGYGIYSGGQRNILEHCELARNGAYGAQIFSTSGGVNDNIIRYNRIHDNSVTSPSLGGLVIATGTNNRAYGNLIYNDQLGIDIHGACSGCKVYNNTIYNITQIGIYWIGNAEIRNNIIKNSGTNNILRQGGTGSSGTNLCDGPNGGSDNCNINTDPRFVSVSGSNFHLCEGVGQPTGCPGPSPAINAGDNLFAQGVTTDIDGNPRPSTGKIDLGAYQRATASPLVVNITTPNSSGSSSTTAASGVLAGTATSSSSITIVNWTNDRGGNGTCAGTNSWNCGSIPFQPGTNVVTIQATDSNANQTSVNHTVFRGSTGPVLAMDFEELSGSTALDSSGNGNHGTIGPGVTRTTGGRVGRGLSFNGTSNAVLTVPNSASLSLANAFTIMVSARPAQAFLDFRTLVIKNYTVFLYAYSHAGYGCSNMAFGGFLFGATGDSFRAVCDSAAWPLDSFTDISLVYDGATLTKYRNGVAVATTPATETITASAGSGTVQVGASDFGENFSGIIDSVRIWNRALSAGEVVAETGTQIAPVTGVVINLTTEVIKYGPGITEKIGP